MYTDANNENRLTPEAAVKKFGKSKVIAWLLWATLGLLGLHRPYVKQGSSLPFMALFITGYLLMGYAANMWVLVVSCLCVGLVLVSWVVDAFRINSWIDENHNQIRKAYTH